jgi:hypothetical protein
MPRFPTVKRTRRGLDGFLAWSGLGLATLVPCAAHATLGQPEASVEADGAKLQSSVKATTHELYRVHEMQAPGGTVIREYAALNGNVFAVTWKGPFMPNLRQTLGQYFDRYVAAAQSHHADHRQLHIQDSDLVVQASGHQHAFAGRAYLPGAIPDGVSIGDLQ